MIRRLQSSFAAKIFAALIGTVSILMAVTFVVVRSETSRQVDLVVDRAVTGAVTQLAELEEIQLLQISRLAGPLIGGVRALAALEQAMLTGDLTEFGDRIGYDVQLAGIDDILVIVTDPSGVPLLTLHDDDPMEGSDPVGVRPVAEDLLAGTEVEARSYRVFEGAFYHLQTLLLEGRFAPLGTITFGLPIAADDMRRIGSVAGAEVCFVVAEACVVGTPLARESLGPALASLVAGGSVSPELESTSGARARAVGSTWSVRALPLVPGRTDGGWRVVAVSLDEILAPFRRITSALLLGGLAALALAVLAATVLSRGLTRPVRALVGATGRVARGDYSADVSVSSTDEIGALAAAFNDMTHGLRLKERYRSVLNKVVSRDVAEELMRGGVELGGENRMVTVLFGDIRGFTALTDGMEPQGVIGLLNECMQRLSDAVEREGGVVDKYVGDEIMAVFGAPIGAPDDAMRAVRAAVAMREAVDELNTERSARGDAPLGLGVGLNTGEAVAGNMGSANRLNYTVLGDVVNLAARLCSGATAGEILVTREVVAAAGRTVSVRAVGGRSFKGFAADVEVFQVEGVEADATRRVSRKGSAVEVERASGKASEEEARPSRTSGKVLPQLMLLAAMSGASAPVSAQNGWPSLSDAGLGWISETGTFQLDLSGRLDLDAFAMNGHSAGLAYGDGVWVSPRLRIFVDVFLGDHVYGLVEVRGDQGPGPTESEWEARVEQAFLRLAGSSDVLMGQVGRFASPFGSYAARHSTDVDPFVRPPLPYDYRTIVSFTRVPDGPDGFVDWLSTPAVFRQEGAPPVWGVPYQWGAMLLGGAGPFGYRLAAMNSSPSSEPDLWEWTRDGFEHPSYVAGVTAAIGPSVSLGASWNRGPFLEEEIQPLLTSGHERFVYHQEIVSIDATIARGSMMMRAEVFADRWEVPGLSDDVRDLSWTLEVQSDVAAGFSVAGRWGAIDFRPLALPGRGDTDWDHDVMRYEASVGYRLARNAGLMLSGSITDQSGPLDPADDLLAVRLWWEF